MKYGILFLIMSVFLIGQAVCRNGPYWLLLWPGTSFALVAGAYLGLGPPVFGKRPDGTMAWHTVAALLPYLLLTWAIWHLARLLSHEDCHNEVIPGLFAGRRPFGHELPTQVAVVVDLTAEFPECRAVRTGRQYISFPMLDTGIAEVAPFETLVRQVANSPEATYIHCAQGHGRTGVLVAAVLVSRGVHATVDEAVAALDAARPRANLNRRQVEFLRRVCR